MMDLVEILKRPEGKSLRQANADRRLVLIARTDPPRASDFVLTHTNRVRAKEGWKDVDLSGLTSDVAIIDALRRNLDEPGKESRDWMAVAVLVAPEPARGRAAAP